MSEIWTTTHGDHVTIFPRRRLAGLRWYFHVTNVRNGQVGEWGEGYSRRIDAVTAAERHHPRIEQP